MSLHSDPALDALVLPFLRSELARPQGPVLFLRARDGAALRQLSLHSLICEQSFKPDADALMQARLDVIADADTSSDAGRYAAVLILPPRQRDEARALFARALSLAAPGAPVVASVPNSEGARTAEADMRAIGGGLDGTLSKHHCRVFWRHRNDVHVDAALLDAWRELDAPRAIVGGRFISRPGVFAWDRIDAASALLVEHLPGDLRGVGADLGAGYGYLAAEVLARNEGVTGIDLYEAEARALALAELNLGNARVPVGFHWHDVTRGIAQRYDFIVSNPPFHAQGRASRPDIGQRFIRVAAEALRPGGRLWLVANRHLPYEETVQQHFRQVRVHAARDGFKVIETVRDGRA